MNTFVSMSAALCARSAAREPTPCAGRAGGGKTGQLRELLREHGPMTARELTRRAQLTNSSLVGALLKVDMQLGRVLKHDGLYSFNHNFDEDLREELSRSAALLRRHGYQVTPPTH